MSTSPLILAIKERLHQAGYSDLNTPLRIAGVEFDFTGALKGRDGRALDLVLLVDTTTGEYGDREAARVRQRIEALSRALDVTGSRYVVTAILAGAALAESVDALSKVCRVLQVEDVSLNNEGKLADALAERQLEDRIRVLLPLKLPELSGPSSGGIGPVIDQLIRALPKGTNKSLVKSLIESSEQGERAVTDAAASAISTAFSVPQSEETS